MKLKKIGFGGGCHWCTEAIFQSLRGVVNVAQGYIKSTGDEHYFSEAIIVSYNSGIIMLKDLIEIHLHTHKSTSNHSFRKKYRSAIYYFEELDKSNIRYLLDQQQQNFKTPIITKILPFYEFLPSREELLNYYLKNPEKPFCKKYVHPKLEFLRHNYGTVMK